MPHLIDDVASGAACSMMARSASTIGLRPAGCLAKNPSMGAPKSARGAPPVAALVAFTARRFVFEALTERGFCVGFLSGRPEVFTGRHDATAREPVRARPGAVPRVARRNS